MWARAVLEVGAGLGVARDGARWSAIGPYPPVVPAVSVVMGIPSVRREVHSYLTDTLHSLISELSPQEKEDSVIVVLIAEVSGLGVGWVGGGCIRQQGAEREAR